MNIVSYRQNRGVRSVNRQRGAALIVALVVLAAVTLIGVSNMQSSGFEMKMTASTVDRNNAFAVADAALRQVEAKLEAGEYFGLSDSALYSNECTAGQCFNASCSDGLCFEGVYTSPNFRYQCEVSPNAASSDRAIFWRNNALDVWDTGSRHKLESVGDADVKYIIEFLCFIDNGESSEFGYLNPNAGDPLFRITVFHEGDRGRAPVMLQSTYSIEF